MKKLSAVFAVFLLALPLVGCGGSTEPVVNEAPVQTQAELDDYDAQMAETDGESTAPQ
ncbi:MAG: hypothetical protein WBD20_21915 [Pirellulaceae bacterium]